jgi:DNA-binding GntR family transcriptional regulator
MGLEATTDATRDLSPLSSPTGLSPVESMSRRDGVMREIRQAIVSGRLEPGEKLTESRLSASLNVSRPTMREALAQLAQEGLLLQEPYRGLRVAVLEADAIMDIARTRVALDTLAVEGILADSSGRRLELVKAAWRDYNRLSMDASSIEANESHITFHRRLWEASANSFLIRLWPVTEAHLIIALAQDQVIHDDPRWRHDNHERLVDAIVGGDREQIQRALIAHTIESAQELVASMQPSDAASAVDLR